MIGKTLYSLSVEHIGKRIRLQVGDSVVEGELLNFDTDLVIEPIREWNGRITHSTQPTGNLTLKFSIGDVAADVKSVFQVIQEDES